MRGVDDTLDFDEGYQALRTGTPFEVPTDFVDVRGPDAATYLQGQMSQDVEAMPVGGRGRSLLLEPNGKLGFWFDVARVADDHYRLEIDRAYGDQLVARLTRFKLRTDAEIGAAEPGWHRVVRFEADAGGGPASLRTDTVADAPARPGVPADAYEAIRIERRVPRMGAEITEEVIPAELGQWLIDGAVSFTKGCYTGQELVARIDSRGGNVPRRLRGLVLDAGPVPPVGAELVGVDPDAAKVVGTVTSASRRPEPAAPVALAFVHRSVGDSERVVVRWAGGETSATLDQPSTEQADLG